MKKIAETIFRNPSIEKEYKRWLRKIGSSEPFKGEQKLGLHDVLRAHFLIADHFADRDNPVGLIGPRDINLLHSALSRQFTSFEGHIKWTKDMCIVATLFYGLIKDHPFHDGNKRTASLCALYHLRKCKRTPSVKHKEFERLTLAIADNSLNQYTRYQKLAKRYGADAPIYVISQFLHSKTRQIDKRYYPIRYFDLKNILKKYGFELEETTSGKLDIVKYETRIMFFIKIKKTRQKVGQIRCHNLNAEVTRKTINHVRKVTELTPGEGFDSEVFYRGVDDIQSLIQEYSTLLRRLRDK